MSAGDIFLGLLAILFPPLAVWIKSGICSCDSLINILLCVLGYLPGLIHAWYIIALYPEPDHDYEPIDDAERGHVTTYYVVGRSQQGQGGSGGYGTTNGQAQGPPPNVPNETRPEAPPAAQGEGAGSSARPPPTYAEAVRGDHKIQTRD